MAVFQPGGIRSLFAGGYVSQTAEYARPYDNRICGLTVIHVVSQSLISTSGIGVLSGQVLLHNRLAATSNLHQVYA